MLACYYEDDVDAHADADANSNTDADADHDDAHDDGDGKGDGDDDDDDDDDDDGGGGGEGRVRVRVRVRVMMMMMMMMMMTVMMMVMMMVMVISTMMQCLSLVPPSWSRKPTKQEPEQKRRVPTAPYTGDTVIASSLCLGVSCDASSGREYAEHTVRVLGPHCAKRKPRRIVEVATVHQSDKS